MTNPEHMAILKIGTVADWNVWRREHPEVRPDFSGADLYGADLHNANLIEANLSEANLAGATLSAAALHRASLNGADLRGANLANASLQGANLKEARLGMGSYDREAFGWLRRIMSAHRDSANLVHANLSEADLRCAVLEGVHLNHANLSGANLEGADLSWANLSWANLSGANLRGADLSKANLYKSDLTKAKLFKANLNRASFVETKLEDANLSNSSVYGISAWNLKTNENTKQLNLVITNEGEPTVTVDDIKLAQFIYLILTNRQIRDVINTVANKAVLILGRFTEKRKEVLDAIADKLRKMDLVPIIFDFKPSEEQDIIETVITLASLSKFIIADVTAARVIADELRSFVPNFAIPVVPVFQPSKKEPKPYASLYTLYRKYTWVLEPVLYESKEHLIEILPDEVIKPAEVIQSELRDIRKGDSV